MLCSAICCCAGLRGLGRDLSPALRSPHSSARPRPGTTSTPRPAMNYKDAAERRRELQAYKEAFDYYDWGKTGSIPVKVQQVNRLISIKRNIKYIAPAQDCKYHKQAT